MKPNQNALEFMRDFNQLSVKQVGAVSAGLRIGGGVLLTAGGMLERLVKRPWVDSVRSCLPKHFQSCLVNDIE